LARTIPFRPSSSNSLFLVDYNLRRVSAVGRGLAILLIAIVGNDQTIPTILLQPCSAVGALPTGIDEAANASEVAHFELLHLVAHSRYPANDLVSRHHGVNGVAPFVADLMDIRVANATIDNLDLYVVGTNLSAA
jgi:hypothetical protein